MSAPARSVRALRLRRLLLPGVLVTALAGGAPVASAIPPGGVRTNPGGAVAVVAPNEIAPGGKVEFTGTGFRAAEEVSVKIDDTGIFRKDTKDEVLTVATAAADGTLKGSVDLSQLNAATPVGPGDHWIRLLSAGRSLIGEFKVVDPAGAVPVPGAPTPAPATPGAPATSSTPGGSGAPAAPAKNLVIEVTEATVKVKKNKGTLKLRAGTAGSAGRLRIRTLEKFKIGKGASKRRDVIEREAYLVDKIDTLDLRVSLTADGKAVLKRRKAFKAVVEITDATGVKVKQTITITR